MRVRCRDSSWRCEEWSEHNIESIRNERYQMIEYLDTALLSALKQVIGGFGVFLVMSLLLGWVGVDLKPLEKPRSELALGESGSYFQLSDNERKELVWMVKAANAAYPGVSKPLGYRSFSRKEWDACAAECDEIVYTEDGYFNVGSGLRGRLMVNMLNEGRVVLALSGCDLDLNTVGEGLKDVSQCIEQYFTCTAQQYEQADAGAYQQTRHQRARAQCALEVQLGYHDARRAIRDETHDAARHDGKLRICRDERGKRFLPHQLYSSVQGQCDKEDEQRHLRGMVQCAAEDAGMMVVPVGMMMPL